MESRQSFNDHRSNQSNIQCHICKKYGHMKAKCLFKDKRVNLAEENGVSNLFMVDYDANNVIDNIWLVDSGCSNHMTSLKSLIKELDETQKHIVRFGDKRQ